MAFATYSLTISPSAISAVRCVRFASPLSCVTMMMVLPLCNQVVEQREDRFGRLGIQVACRFVRDDDGRIVGEGARDGHALLLSAREHVGSL